MPRHCVVCIDNQNEIRDCPCGQKPPCDYCNDLKKDVSDCDCTEADAPSPTPEAFVIQKDIPLPGRVWRKQDGWKIIEPMEVGDSMFFPEEEHQSMRHKMRLAKVAGRHHTCRKMPGGYRVWRVE